MDKFNLFLLCIFYNVSITFSLETVAEGQGNTVGLIVVVYSDQISTILSNKIR